MTIFILTLSIPLLLSLVYIFLKFPYLAANIILISYASSEIFNLSSKVIINVGFGIYLYDIIFFLMLVASILRRKHSKNIFLLSFTLFVLMIIFNIVRGIQIFGLESIDPDVRLFLYLYISMVYFASFDIKLSRVISYLKSISIMLLAVSSFRMIATLLGLSISESWREISNSAGGFAIRVITAEQAFVLGICFLAVFINRYNDKSIVSRIIIYATPLTLIILQHRTVWISIVLGIIAIISIGNNARTRLNILLGSAIMIAGILIFSNFSETTEQISSSVQGSASNSETFEWRMEGWRQLLFDSVSAPKNVLDWIIGVPFGYGYQRIILGLFIDVNPHNFYIHTLLRSGIVGFLTIFSSLLIMPIVYIKRKHNDVLGKQLVVSVFVCYFTYFISYPISIMQGVIISVIAAHVLSKWGKSYEENSLDNYHIQ